MSSVLKHPKNYSTVQCPDCGKPLVNIGSKVERIHPIPKFISDYHNYILLAFCSASTIFFVSGVLGHDRFIGFALVGSYLFSAFILYLLVRVFSLWRITECPYCGYYNKRKLGRSNSA
jgi:DNA-directed RNA polymerase subunit RPC12/RpoP